MKLRWMFVLPCLACAGLALHACGDSSSGGISDGPGAPSDAGAATDVPRVPAADVMTVPPPEVEERRAFQTPQAGGRYVYVANPARDTVAVIDSRTLAIQSVEAGDGPTQLVTVPGNDVALVINVNSHTLTILRTTEAGTTTSSVPVVSGANAIAVAPDGRHAVAFLDSDAPGARFDSGSFQDVSVITLEPGMDRAVQLSVGFRPLDVSFSADGASAFVITEDGISPLRFADITGPTIVPNVSLDEGGTIVARDAGADASGDAGGDASDDAPTDAAAAPEVPARDVSLTPDGRYAIARVEGTSTLRLVDMTTRTITSLNVGGVVTDLDIAPSGAYALAVVRDRSEVLRLPIPGAFADPASVTRTEVTGEFVGSVTFSPDGQRALLYTTALPLERVTMMELADASPLRVVRLRKSVRAVAFAPDGRTALVVHNRIIGDPAQAGISAEESVDRSYGYTLLDTATRFAKLQLTPADVGPFALVPGGAFAFVLLRDDARMIAQAHRVSLRSFVVDTLVLGSPPSSVGAVPGTERAFIGQEHPEGRITFVDWNTGALQSVTGFELNSRVVE